MDDVGTEDMVCLAILFGLRLSAETDAPPAFCGVCFKNGDDSEDIPGEATALGGLCIVCFHTDRCSMSMEYVLDKTILEPVAADSVGSEHDAYTPFKDAL